MGLIKTSVHDVRMIGHTSTSKNDRRLAMVVSSVVHVAAVTWMLLQHCDCSVYVFLSFCVLTLLVGLCSV